MPVIQMTVVAASRRPRFTSRGDLDAVFAPIAGIDFLCGACDRVVLARVVPKFALEHSFFVAPHVLVQPELAPEALLAAG